jgi:L,D-transpeptidase ErfK/SrfK
MKIIVFILSMLFCFNVFAADFENMTGKLNQCRQDFSVSRCRSNPEVYQCVKIKMKTQYIEWTDIEKNKKAMRLLQIINRRNTIVWKHHCIAVPSEWINNIPFDNWDLYKILDVPLVNNNYKEKVVIVDLRKLVWSAYSDSQLRGWGVANGGRGVCKETGLMQCKTPIGEWEIIKKDGPVSKSTLYPIDCKDKKKCGHPMFWKMQFHPNGTALHGDKNVLGANVSHGCVRLFKSDAKWLSNNFVDVGTKVVILHY